MGAELAKYWGPLGIVIAVCFAAIGLLFKRLDESHKRAEERESLAHTQRLKEHEAHAAQLNSLHERCRQEHEVLSKQIDELHKQRLEEHKKMFDEIVVLHKNLGATVYESATSLVNLNRAIEELKGSNDDNTRALHHAIGELAASHAKG